MSKESPFSRLANGLTAAQQLKAALGIPEDVLVGKIVVEIDGPKIPVVYVQIFGPRVAIESLADIVRQVSDVQVNPDCTVTETP